MTELQKVQIKHLREQGQSMGKIAKQMGISVNTVKTFCRRNNVVCTHDVNKSDKDICPVCGNELEHVAGKRKKRFCSDKCRMYWHNHHESKDRGARHEHICECCGESFLSYAKRKYCSHPCYIKSRFGGVYEE